MQKNAAHTYAISSLLVLSLTGCAWIPSTPLVHGATSAQPVPGPTPVANGSIFQSAQPINYGYQPLFEDRRPRNIGDTLTIVLQENVSASKSSSANASRDGKSNFGFDTVPRYLQGLFGNARADVEASGGPPGGRDVRADDVEKHARRFTKRWPVQQRAHSPVYQYV